MTARADLALDKALAERSLHEFFRQSWHITTPGSELCDGWHLEAMAEHLQAVITGALSDLLILVPPRCGKTILTSICLPAWAWTRRPELQFLCASYGQRLSNRHSTDCRRLMQSRWYQARWGYHWKFVGDVNRITEMQNNCNGHRISTSIDGISQGEGGDILVLDDPHAVKDVARYQAGDRARVVEQELEHPSQQRRRETHHDHAAPPQRRPGESHHRRRRGRPADSDGIRH